MRNREFDGTRRQWPAIGTMPRAKVAELRPKFPDARILASYGSRTIRQCSVQNCDNLALDGEYCNQCRAEIAALDCWAVEKALKQRDRAERRERLGRSAIEMWLACWDWAKAKLFDYVLAVFVIWAIAYISVQYSDAIVEWLNALAGVR